MDESAVQKRHAFGADISRGHLVGGRFRRAGLLKMHYTRRPAELKTLAAPPLSGFAGGFRIQGVEQRRNLIVAVSYGSVER